MLKTIYITAGHSTKSGQDNGAVTKYGNEGQEARKFVTALAKELYKRGIMTYTDNDDWSLLQTINWLGTRVSKPDYTIDVHFNAFNTEAAHGTEVLIPNVYNSKELDLAKSIVDKINSITKIEKRINPRLGNGIKTESDSHHSRLGILSSNKLSSANNILIEMCFISNPDDMKKYRDNFDSLVIGIADVISKTL